MTKYTYLLFFGVSCILSVLMFIQIPEPDDIFYIIIMGVTAFSFEVGKIQMWKMWAEKRKVLPLIFSLLFISVSILASVSFVVGTLNYQYDNRDTVVREQSLWEERNAALNKEITSLTDAIDKLDPTWVSSKIKLSKRLDELRIQQAALEKPKENISQKISGVFVTLSQVMGIKSPKTLMVYFFTVFSILLEAGAVLLSPFAPEMDEKKARELKMEKENMLMKARKFSKVYTIGTAMLGEGDVIRDIDYLLENTSFSVKEINSVLLYFQRKGFIRHRGADYVLAMDKAKFLKSLKLLEETV